MKNSFQIKAADVFVTCGDFTASVCRLRNTSAVSIDYKVGEVTTALAAGAASGAINVSNSTREVSVRRADLNSSAVSVLIEWGLTADEAYELASSEVGSVSASDITLEGLGGVPTSRTVNGHALSSNVTVTAADVGLGSVENTALSTWAGSTNLDTVGTITTGTWHGAAIADAYIASAPTWNAKVSFPGFGTTAGTAAEGNDARLSDARTPLAHNQAWSTITSTPTTLSGYGITDAQGLDSDLTALAGLSTTGLVARTGSGTAATRTITGTTDQVIVENGDGVSGNPTLSLPQSIAKTSKPQFARLGIGVSPSAASLEIDSGTGERPSSITGNGIRMSAPNSTQNSIESCGWGATPLRIIGRRAGGTRADPTAPTNDLPFLNLEGTGYDGTTHQSSPAVVIGLRTNGDWSETNRGTQITFQGTPLNSTTPEYWMVLKNSLLLLPTYGAGTLVTDSSGWVTTSSDASLKTVTGSFTRGLADVLKLTPRTYRWNEKSGMNTEDENVGFIAQEVLGAVPEAVGQYRTTEMEIDGKKTKKREKSELLTLSDRPLIAALVNAVKELKADNDTLRARVSALENGKAAK